MCSNPNEKSKLMNRKCKKNLFTDKVLRADNNLLLVRTRRVNNGLLQLEGYDVSIYMLCSNTK